MSQKHIDIDPAVAYAEQAQEVAYLRNRNLVLAQQLANATARVDTLVAELAEVRPPVGPTPDKSAAAVEG